MKIHIPNLDHIIDNIGGGNTFTKNFLKFLSPHDLVKLHEADVIFIVGSSTITKDQWKEIKDSKIKTVLRLDGIPEDWRNRGHGVSRLREIIKYAHGVVCQTDFVFDTTYKYITYPHVQGHSKQNVVTIYNGIDKSVFKPPVIDKPSEHSYLVVGYRKDPNKRFEEVIEFIRRTWAYAPEPNLISFTLAGRFPTEYRKYNFGFFNNEPIKYIGIVKSQEEMADIMRKHRTLIYPAFADPSPNTVLEALHCGMDIVIANPYGGIYEVAKIHKEKYDFDMQKCVDKYFDFFEMVYNE